MKKKFVFGIVALVAVLGSIALPLSFARAQETSTVTINGQTTIINTSNFNDYESRLQSCSFTNIGACGVNFVYYLVLTPSAWFARISGEVFDYFLQYSIDTNSYKGAGSFIERGWSIIRDIGNVMFIFALLYIAISHILQFSTSSTKKFLINLIIAALLINFSLFFSRIIIDAGNILARTFYNNIEIPNDDNLQYHTISQGIVAHVNPQRILASDLFLPKHSNAPTQTADDKLGNGYAFTILALASAVNIIIAITFLSVCLLFVGRVVGLWFLMIFSPFAFASIAVPNSGKMFGQFSFSGWLDQTMKLSFMAPVFMFFLFLLIMFLQVIFQTNIPETNQSTVQKLMAIVIPFAMVVFILNKAKSVAADLAGEAGSAVKSITGKIAGFGLGAVGLAGGAVIGATAFAGRNVVGRIANASIEQGRFQERVRLNNIRAISYDKKAREAQTEKERQANERKASQARAAAARNAIMAKQLDRARKGTFDPRRSDFLQKQVIGSAAGKAIGSQLGSLTKEFAGEALKVGFGKGKDMNRKKFEDEKEKKRLDTAKLYDRQDRETIELIAYSARQGMAGQSELIENIDKYMKEIKDSVLITDEERAKKLEYAGKWRERAETATKPEEILEVLTGIKERDENGKVKKDEQGNDKISTKGRDDVAKKDYTERRNSYADVVQAKNVNNINNSLMNAVFNFNIGERDAMAIADKIRKKPEGALDKIKKILDEDKPPTPPPATPPPGGGAQSPH